MLLKRLAIVVCFIAASLITAASQSQTPIAIGQQECIARILNDAGIQSANTTRNFLVTMKRGRRRSFEQRHRNVGTPVAQTGESGRVLPFILVNDIQTATMVRNGTCGSLVFGECNKTNVFYPSAWGVQRGPLGIV